MSLIEKALAAAILEMCELNDENRIMRKRLDATTLELHMANKENLERKLKEQAVVLTPYSEHQNYLCSMNYSENAEGSAKDATQQTDTECPHS